MVPWGGSQQWIPGADPGQGSKRKYQGRIHGWRTRQSPGVEPGKDPADLWADPADLGADSGANEY